jgi:hypothetical protein
MINERRMGGVRPNGRNGRFHAGEAMMNILTNALIAVAAVGVVGYALISHLQSRAPRPRARAGGGDGGSDSYSDTTSEGFSLGSWFSSDSSGNSTDSGSCSTSDSGGSGDCGGGGDGGGGGSSD